MEPVGGRPPCLRHNCHPICGHHHHHHRHVHACSNHMHHCHHHVHACPNHRHHHHLLPHPRGIASFPNQNRVTNSEEAEEGEEEDDDPMFVLTDEWREFFAKSEAKRKLEKQQAKRKGNK